jgi:hypothetical protein
MGADWIRKSESRFRHQIQEQATRQIGSTGMFLPAERTSITYACHWLDEKVTLPLDARLTIFQRTPNSRMAVMYEEAVVAEVRDEAAADLQRMFSDYPKLQRMLDVRIVRVGKPSEPFYVQAVAKRARKAKGAAN